MRPANDSEIPCPAALFAHDIPATEDKNNLLFRFWPNLIRWAFLLQIVERYGAIWRFPILSILN
jgi:hypothetical protein